MSNTKAKLKQLMVRYLEIEEGFTNLSEQEIQLNINMMKRVGHYSDEQMIGILSDYIGE